MKTVLQDKDNAYHACLYIAFELSAKKWKLGFSNGDKHRIKTVDARDWKALLFEIESAKDKLRCTNDCEIISCYEAGRDGFWIHRALVQEGINNKVIDSASIEVSRRKRKVKTDRIDVIGLIRLLMRYGNGEKQALHIIRVPSVDEEDQRRLNRERDRLIKERGSHSARLKSLFIAHGIKLEKMGDIKGLLPTAKAAVIGYDLPAGLKAEITRELKRFELVDQQVKELESQQKARSSTEDTKVIRIINQLCLLKGVSWQSSWGLSTEFFSWRAFKNGKQVGACAGLTPTPYDSGDSTREQGISKAGNKRIRKLMVELSWLWLRYQPKSKLSLWFEKRFGSGGKRMRRIGIVALARKLLVALWHYVEQGVLPEGAVFNAG